MSAIPITPDATTKPADTSLYETPPSFFRRLDAEFSFQVDAFADMPNHLCSRFITEDIDAFKENWTLGMAAPTVFANPPYGKKILGAAVRRMAQQSEANGQIVVGLVPPNCGTKWWHQCVMREASEVRFVRGRLSFAYRGVPLTQNRYDSCVLVFRPGVRGPMFSSMDAHLR